MTLLIPIAGMYIDLDLPAIAASLPPAPGPVGQIRQSKFQLFAPGATTPPQPQGFAFTPTGVKLSLTPSAGSRVRVCAAGIVGHSDAGVIVHFTLFCNGLAVPLPSAWSGLSAVRSRDGSNVESFALCYEEDAPEVSAPLEFELAWRTHSGVAHLGKRPGDTVMNCPVWMRVEELTA